MLFRQDGAALRVDAPAKLNLFLEVLGSERMGFMSWKHSGSRSRCMTPCVSRRNPHQRFGCVVMAGVSSAGRCLQVMTISSSVRLGFCRSIRAPLEV
ncbi:MAG: hypothetical protein Ct9H300mP1_32030 [Planctomycetaceae bacterium]|nr:MAG: hypothetical protein Ct9H300mP1_32030 [Planctomycetaceae bacterium]